MSGAVIPLRAKPALRDSAFAALRRVFDVVVRDAGSAVRDCDNTGAVVVAVLDLIARDGTVNVRDWVAGNVERVVTVLVFGVTDAVRAPVVRSRADTDWERPGVVMRDVAVVVFLRFVTELDVLALRRVAARAASAVTSAKPACDASSAKDTVKINLNPFIPYYRMLANL